LVARACGTMSSPLGLGSDTRTMVPTSALRSRSESIPPGTSRTMKSSRASPESEERVGVSSRVCGKVTSRPTPGSVEGTANSRWWPGRIRGAKGTRTVGTAVKNTCAADEVPTLADPPFSAAKVIELISHSVRSTAAAIVPSALNPWSTPTARSIVLPRAADECAYEPAARP
jgi:hypothetical protein